VGDRFGRRRLLVIGLSLFTVASVACALAPGIGWLIAARAVQGTGSAMIMPEALTLLSAAFPQHQRARALGMFASLTGLATLGGPLVGGAVVQALSWQWIFWLNVPIGLIVIPLVRAKIEESTGARQRLDIGGLVLVTGGALGLVWGLVRANTAGWTSAQTLGPLVAGVLLAVAFVRWEMRVAQPMLPMRYFRSRAFAGGNAVSVLLYGSTVGSAFLMAQFMQATLGYGPLSAGLHLAPWTACLFIVGPIAGARINQFGERPLIAVGLLLQAAGFAWIALIARPDLPYPLLVGPLVVAGIGVSMAMPAAQHVVIGAVPPPAIGTASGTFNMLRQLGGTFGVTIAAAVFAATGSYVSPASFNAGFVPAIGALAGLALLGAVAGLCTPGRRAEVTAPKPAMADVSG
jgi:EmrB/QacA subfamily drug resistance transporter